MKRTDIVGDNYAGSWNRERTGCRAVVLREDGKILIVAETALDTWMLPGGGLEPGENDQACCIREVAEETGVVIETSGCLMEIDEYYENWKYTNRYYLGVPVGTAPVRLTPQEEKAGLSARWVLLKEAVAEFSGHERYRDKDEMKRGIYLREYTALRELIPLELIPDADD